MIINRDKGFAFIHVPKAAGTSIRNSLMESSDGYISMWGPQYSHKLQRYVDTAHITVEDRHAFKELWGLDELLTFAIIREPVSRFLSGLRYYNRRNLEMTVEGMISLLEKHPTLPRYDHKYIHFCPQHFFLFDNNGKSKVDHIYQMSSSNVGMDKMWENVGQLLGLTLNNLERSNTTDADEIPDVLSESTRNRIREFYNRDYVLLGA